MRASALTQLTNMVSGAITATSPGDIATDSVSDYGQTVSYQLAYWISTDTRASRQCLTSLRDASLPILIGEK